MIKNYHFYHFFYVSEEIGLFIILYITGVYENIFFSLFSEKPQFFF